MSVIYIKQLQQSDSRLHKERVIQDALNQSKLGNPEAHNFLKLASLTYNGFITFGVKNINDINPNNIGTNPWNDFNTLLTKLAYRELTGNAARDAIEYVSLQFDGDQWNNFCAPVIRRDLRCGITDTTLNKILKNTEYVVPTFGCQLATNCEGIDLHGEYILQPKYDGARMLAVVHFNERYVECFSRNGKIYSNFSTIEAELTANIDRIRQHFGRGIGVVFDGEVMANTFQSLMTQTRRKTEVDTSNMSYFIYDILPLEDFQRGHWNKQQCRRDVLLKQIVSEMIVAAHIKTVETIVIDADTAEGKDIMHRYANDQVNAGYEGIMIKGVDAPYECKRSNKWLKYKPVYTYDLKITAIVEGEGKYTGMLGAFVCEGLDAASGKYIKVNVGSGYSDVDRVKFYDSNLIGRMVEVMADAITQNADGSYSLRFPRFKCFRPDKD